LIELYTHKKSFIHQTEARVKIFFTLVFLVCVNLTPPGAWSAYIQYFTVLIVELLLSHLSIKKVLMRSLISFPFILAVFPIIFTGADPHIPLVSIVGFQVMISQPGVIRFISIAIQSWLSVLVAILLTCTTSFKELMRAFYQLGIPKILVTIFSLMWRYLSLMIDESINLMRARNSRSGLLDGKHKSGGSVWWRAQVTGKMAGNLLLRSLERSERVYAAMSARGYNGEVLQTKDRPITRKELFLAIISVIVCFAILGITILLY
jgi:cobalt/nickel transport system permease protein